ncbi:MAG: MarC family protein [Alphaproteobacteria bacterium]|nr:MarC family protein [Alphaproteobacteria bacterium]
MFALLSSAFITLFVVLDPPGLAPVFISLTGGMTPATKRTIAVEAALVSFGVLVGAMFFGLNILTMLGISLASFRIAGGLLLFAIAFEMVFERRQERKNSAAVPRPSPAVFPLAIPLMAGPGAITAAVLLGGRADGNWLSLGLFAAVMALVLAMCLGVFLLSGPIERLLGERGQNVLGRLLGVLLAALAVQYVADGIQALMKAA